MYLPLSSGHRPRSKQVSRDNGTYHRRCRHKKDGVTTDVFEDCRASSIGDAPNDRDYEPEFETPQAVMADQEDLMCRIIFISGNR